MNDEAHQRQGMGQGQAQHVQGHPHQAWKEKAFRLAVARKYFAEGKDTKEVAAELGCEESQVWNVLDKIKRERINA